MTKKERKTNDNELNIGYNNYTYFLSFFLSFVCLFVCLFLTIPGRCDYKRLQQKLCQRRDDMVLTWVPACFLYDRGKGAIFSRWLLILHDKKGINMSLS